MKHREMIHPNKASWDAAQALIRERAYYLWLDCGRPEGQSLSFWAMGRYVLEQERKARREILSESAAA